MSLSTILIKGLGIILAVVGLGLLLTAVGVTFIGVGTGSLLGNLIIGGIFLIVGIYIVLGKELSL